MPCSYGLVHSRNTMSVRVGQFAGLDAVQKVANNLGIAQNVPHGPATYIGSFETNLKDLTAAYTVFPNAGIRKQAYSSSESTISNTNRYISPRTSVRSRSIRVRRG